jgi:hypothetical protein
MNSSQRFPGVIVMMIMMLLFVAPGCSNTSNPKSDVNNIPPPAAVDDATSATDQATAQIDPEADRILKETSDALAKSQRFSCNVEVWDDAVLSGGHKLSTTKIMQAMVRRPNGVHIEVQSPKHTRGIWYDGKTVTMLDRVKNLYGVVDAPDNIDAMVDAVEEKFGISIPLEDLILADPYASAIKAVKAGASFGKATILGTPCQHIAFGTDNVDWQLWVADDTHLPRKIVITYKNEDADPQFTAIFSDWKLNADIPDSEFNFSPPPGAAKINVLPAKPDADTDNQ